MAIAMAAANCKIASRRIHRAPTPSLVALPQRPAEGMARFGRVLLFAHLLLSPLIFYREALEVFEYNKVALLSLTAVTLIGLGLAAGGSQLVRLGAHDSPSALVDMLRPVLRSSIVWG